jgi:hypothetical protein
MPQESISQILNNRYREFELARNENDHSHTSILNDQTIDIGEFYGCLCHQAPHVPDNRNGQSENRSAAH